MLMIWSLIVTSGSAASAQIPKLFCADGHVYDVLRNPHAGAEVYGNAAAWTDEEGYWVICWENPYAADLTATKRTSGRPALADRSHYFVTLPSDYHDFYLPFILETPVVSPNAFQSLTDTTITIRVETYAPPETVVTNSLEQDPMDYSHTDSDGFSFWTQDHVVPAGTPEGWYKVRAEGKDATGSVITYCAYWCARSFVVDNTPPEFSDPSPATTSTDSPLIGVTIEDSLSGVLANSLRMKLDGSEVEGSFNRATGRFSAQASGLDEGNHLVEVEGSDRAGNQSTYSFSFLVDTASPILHDPAPIGEIDQPSPEIRMFALDDSSGIAAESIEMTLSNGIVSSSLEASFDPATGRVSYQVPEGYEGGWLGEFPLPDGEYTVYVVVRDLAGNSAVISWSFLVKTLLR